MIKRKETKLIVENWRKLLKENKTITEAADIMQMLSDIGSQIVQYSPAIVGTVAAGAGVSKIKSSLEERKKKKKIAELSILFIERFISEINEDINNDLKANEAKEKYREGQEILNQVKNLSRIDKDYFIHLSSNTDPSRSGIPRRKHEKLLNMKNKLFEINN